MLLTIFTPTYNRAYTLGRLYESLCRQSCKDFEWLLIDDGSTDETKSLIRGFIEEGKISITYHYKNNGGLYTGYNAAYELITTELSVCVDSDDFMPDNAVELILAKWKAEGSGKYAGIVGLDFYKDSTRPIGGFFPDGMYECFFLDLYIKRIHRGDSKYVLRTDLMKSVAPQVGFDGEKNFNPVYLQLKVCDKYPLLVLNENLCFVDYQQDGMANNIYRQYVDSPRSFAKLRLLEMNLKRSTFFNRLRCAIHYVSSCLIARQPIFSNENNHKMLAAVALLPGWIWSKYILYKEKHY
ncbi:MAG: glycosyltransferase family 2 protein [Muribaculaceae bacterium]|nr:glycosyltransferase family 2 protein [Muribaculaceae bacterium]